MTTAKAQARRIAARALRDRFALFLAALSVGAACLILLRELNYGPALDFDSVNYIAVAHALLAGDGFTELNARAYTRWAPLWPMMQAGAALITFSDPRDVAGPLNAILFGLTVFAAGRWMRRRVRNPFMLAFGCLATALSLPLTNAASWGWSDTAFILFTTLALFNADEYLRGGDRRRLMWMAAFTALACLTRYLGVALIFAGAALLLLRSGGSARERLADAAAYGAAAGTPICLWMLRNFLIAAGPIGYRGSETQSLAGIVETALSAETAVGVFAAMGEWAFIGFPSGALSGLEPPLGFAAAALAGTHLALMAAACAYCLSRGREWMARGRGLSFCVCGAYVLCYTLLVAAAAAAFETEALRPRYVYALYIPALLSALLALDALLARARGSSIEIPPPIQKFYILPKQARFGVRRLALGAVGSAMALWLIYAAAMNARAIARHNAHYEGGYNIGYSSRLWVNSETLAAIRAAPFDGHTLTTRAAAIFIHTDRPRPHFGTPGTQECLNRFMAIADADAYIFWFANAAASNDDSDDGFERLLSLRGPRLEARLSDGAIFKVERGATPAASVPDDAASACHAVRQYLWHSQRR